jgi:hypothetical protein
MNWVKWNEMTNDKITRSLGKYAKSHTNNPKCEWEEDNSDKLNIVNAARKRRDEMNETS